MKMAKKHGKPKDVDPDIVFHENHKLKQSYEQKISEISSKEKDLLQKDELLKKDIADLQKKKEEFEKLDKVSLTSEIKKLIAQKSALEQSIDAMHKKISHLERAEREASQNVERKLDQLHHHQRSFEQLFKATKLLEEEQKKRAEYLTQLGHESEQKRRSVQELDRKLRYLNPVHQKSIAELESYKLNELRTLMKRIQAHISRKETVVARELYEEVRRIYRDLSAGSKQKVFKEIMRLSSSIK